MKSEQHKIALKAGLSLLEKWKLTDSEKSRVLGFDLKDRPKTLFSEQEIRLSLLLNIHSELKQIFTNPVNLYGYMTMVNHNSPFKGKRPVDLACSSLDGLHSVYDAIRQIRAF